jgi:phytoene synthase
MSGTPPAAAAAEFCAAEVRRHDFVRYASALFAPPQPRRALMALFAFNVEIVRVRENIRQPMAGEIRLQWWRDMLAGAGHGYVEGSPVAAELLHAIEAHALPVARLSRLIEEHQFDLYNDPMPTMAALETYFDGTESTLVALAAQILGDGSPEAAHVARHAGIAMGMADAIASLPREASRRQAFVPAELLDAHEAKAEDMFSGVETPMLRRALAALNAQARQHLDAAFAELGRVQPPARAAFLPLATVHRTLDDAPHWPSIFQPQPLSRLRILWTLWRASRSRMYRGVR